MSALESVLFGICYAAGCAVRLGQFGLSSHGFGSFLSGMASVSARVEYEVEGLPENGDLARTVNWYFDDIVQDVHRADEDLALRDQQTRKAAEDAARETERAAKVVA